MSRLAECRHEAELVAAVTSGRWPSAVDPALREHVASCAVCADVLQVAEVDDGPRTGDAGGYAAAGGGSGVVARADSRAARGGRRRRRGR